jgi:replicative DNA helicase
MEVARRFLRCLIRINENDNLADNAFLVLDSPVNFKEVSSSLQNVYDFIKSYYNDLNDYPTVNFLQEEFVSRAMLDEKDELEDLKNYPLHTGSGFKFIIKECITELHRKSFNKVLKEANDINNQEFKIGKRLLKGTKDALDYVIENSEQFYYQSLQERTEVELSKATNTAYERYLAAKENSLANYGILSGLREIDVNVKGIKRKEMMLIAGSVGECKTTLAINWAYNACVQGGFNVLYVTLEMSKENLEDILYCIHANNPVLQRENNCDITMTRDEIKNGEMSPRQEFWYKYALTDWSLRGATRKDKTVPYGNFTVWEPNSELTPTLLAAKLNYFNRIAPIHLVIVDYPGLMIPDDHSKNMNEGAALNQIMKKLKNLALTFNGNEGVAMLCPFQINREGKKDVVKRTEKEGESKSFKDIDKPVYNTFHLSYANEAERSADYVIYTYLNQELRDSNTIHIGCIKNRHGAIFKPFIGETALSCGRIWFNADHYDVPLGKVVEASL